MIKSIVFVLILLHSIGIIAQNNLPYPVIFVHALAGGEDSFALTMEYLKDHDSLGSINVFDICLNSDNDNSQSLMANDVKWTDFNHNGSLINLGRRNYAADINDFVDGWSTGTNIYAVNFQEERIRGASGSLNDLFDYSDQAAIFKHGYALKEMIQEVLSHSNAEKVILYGYGLSALSIREYLQRTDANGNHVNWINPLVANGHKVARVTTLGGAHSGSLFATDPTKSALPQGLSEANRDVIYEYDSYPNCGGFPKGIYLYGGAENCISGTILNSTFYNVDINCDGDEVDSIVGINQGVTSFDYNSSMPLPLNIKYTYVTNNFIDLGGNNTGSGTVLLSRQWIYNSNNVPSPVGLSDTLLIDMPFYDQPKSFYNFIRATDEPYRYDLAYNLVMNREIIGYVTYQMNMLANDVDTYKVSINGADSVGVILNNNFSGVDSIEVYNSSQILIKHSLINQLDTVYVNTASLDSIYIKIFGTAYNESWENPYKLKIFPFIGTCSNPISLTCGVAYNGSTVEGETNFGQYNCGGQLEAGKENIHVITVTETSNLTASLSNLNGVDLDVHILTDCDSQSCITRNDNTAIALGIIAGTYYIVVDGYTGAGQMPEGNYTLEVSCVTVCDTVSNVIVETTCDSVFNLGGQLITSSGTYTEVFQTISGCDSSVMLELTMYPSFDTLIQAAVCDSVFNFGTQVITQSGSYSETFQTVLGCDSNVVLNVTIQSPNDTNMVEEICNGESFVLGSQTLTSRGTYSEIYTNISGCDSTVNLVLVVKVTPIITMTENNGDLISSGGVNYQWFLDGDSIQGATSQIYSPTQNGVYTVITTEFNDCMGEASYNLQNVSINDLINESKLKIIPNPTKGLVTISSNTKVQVILYNIIGEIIFISNSVTELHLIDLSSYPKGEYLVKVIGESSVDIKKIIYVD